MPTISSPAVDGPRRAASLLPPSIRRVGQADRLLVLTHDLGQHDPLGREIRRVEAADERDEDKQKRERERPGGVQHRDRGDQRRAREVGGEHRTGVRRDAR